MHRPDGNWLICIVNDKTWHNILKHTFVHTDLMVTMTNINKYTITWRCNNNINMTQHIFFIVLLYCICGPCAKAVLPLAHMHSQVGAEIHIQLLTDYGVLYMPSSSRHGTHTFNCVPTQYLFVGSAGTWTLPEQMYACVKLVLSCCKSC